MVYVVKVDKDNAAGAIRKIMVGNGLSCKGVADLAGISRQSIQQSLTSRSRNMRVSTLVKISESLGYDVLIVRRDN